MSGWRGKAEREGKKEGRREEGRRRREEEVKEHQEKEKVNAASDEIRKRRAS